ncbi:MAG: cupin domain-containing protein [Gaiellaceae bacterium]
MIRAGDLIENAVTGERLRFHQTSAETNGELVVVEAFVQPGGQVAAAHVHPHQQERFLVVSGAVGFKRGREKLVAGPGDEIVVEPSTAHKFWNAGDTEARFYCEIRPARQFERLIETMFGLAADGKTSKKGMPQPLRLASIAKAHFEDVRLPVVPAWMQRTALAMGAPMGWLYGYGATYEPVADLRPALA